MEAAVALSVCHEAVALFILLPAVVDILICTLGEVVVLHKVVACVVRRVNVNHLHLAEVILAQEFQHLQVVALNVEVLRGVEVHALLAAGAQCVGGRGVGQSDGVALVGPGELVAFLGAFHDVLREFLPQLVEVNRSFRFPVLIKPLGEAVGEEFSYALYVFVHLVGGLHIEFVHIYVCYFTK